MDNTFLPLPAKMPTGSCGSGDLRSLMEIGSLNLFYSCLVFLVFGKRNLEGLEGAWRALGGHLVEKVKSLKPLTTRRLKAQRH
jgi:hypothetical protein